MLVKQGSEYRKKMCIMIEWTKRPVSDVFTLDLVEHQSSSIPCLPVAFPRKTAMSPRCEKGLLWRRHFSPYSVEIFERLILPQGSWPFAAAKFRVTQVQRMKQNHGYGFCAFGVMADSCNLLPFFPFWGILWLYNTIFDRQETVVTKYFVAARLHGSIWSIFKTRPTDADEIFKSFFHNKWCKCDWQFHLMKIILSWCLSNVIRAPWISSCTIRGVFKIDCVFRPSATKSGRPYGVMYVSSCGTSPHHHPPLASWPPLAGWPPTTTTPWHDTVTWSRDGWLGPLRWRSVLVLA